MSASGGRGVKDEPSVEPSGEVVQGAMEGVVFERLIVHADHRGTLIEVIDLSGSFWSEPVVWAYAFTIRPGRIKGWGMHRLQADRYFVAGPGIRVVLFDDREGSSTRGHFAEFQFTELTPGLLRIPPGVWHADQNWGGSEARVMNFPTRPYDHANPDKYRIDPHSGEIPFDWVLPDG